MQIKKRHRNHRRARGAGGRAAALSLSLAAACAAVSTPAAAQQPAIALDRFDPAPAGDRMFAVPSPYAMGPLTPYAMLLADYAHNPLILRLISNRKPIGYVVTSQFYLHLDAGIAIKDRLLLNIDVPVALAQSGNSYNTNIGTFTAPTTTQFGDIRLAARVRLWGEDLDPFQIAIGGYLWLPTGNGSPGSYVSDGKIRGLPQIIAGGHTDRFVYSAALGPKIESTQQFATVTQGSMFELGAGAGVLLLDNRHLQLGAELTGGVSLKNLSRFNNNAELIFDVRYKTDSDIEVGVGVGPGFASGIGTPDVRGVMMIAYAPEFGRDRDGDGIPDDVDACPLVPGVRDADPKKNGCPVADCDGDGIPNDVDACPAVPGVRDPDPKKNGCPPDRDGDKIPDDVDACPDVPGEASSDPRKNGCPAAPPDCDGDQIPNDVDACPCVKGVADPDPKKNGCPPDRDGDKIPDAEDACPDVAGEPSKDPRLNGCPQKGRVVVSKSEIFILDQVEFDTDKSTIKKVSDVLLDNVAGVLREHTEILKIEVQGHTDNQGTAAHNQVLSEARAHAVLEALVKRRIDRARLIAHGYGETRPLPDADNNTAEGRQRNRRVQFIILGAK